VTPGSDPSLLPQKMGRESAAMLASVPLFFGLPKRHLEKIVKLAVTKHYVQDAKMVIAGRPGRVVLRDPRRPGARDGGRVHRRG